MQTNAAFQIHPAAAHAAVLTVLVLGYRWQPDVLVARPGRRETELLGRFPARSPAVLLQPRGELRGHELLLQL